MGDYSWINTGATYDVLGLDAPLLCPNEAHVFNNWGVPA